MYVCVHVFSTSDLCALLSLLAPHKDGHDEDIFIVKKNCRGSSRFNLFDSRCDSVQCMCMCYAGACPFIYLVIILHVIDFCPVCRIRLRSSLWFDSFRLAIAWCVLMCTHRTQFMTVNYCTYFSFWLVVCKCCWSATIFFLLNLFSLALSVFFFICACVSVLLTKKIIFSCLSSTSVSLPQCISVCIILLLFFSLFLYVCFSLFTSVSVSVALIFFVHLCLRKIWNDQRSLSLILSLHVSLPHFHLIYVK